ncbi:MAG TPA: molybdopterin-dependent oxidoreductase, partial [Telluria sp.]|nr:molybdopterin-dependent oxidoreductase [Telluria sp.]
MTVVKKTAAGEAVPGAKTALQQGLARAASATIKRRSFLLRAGLTAGAAGIARHMPFNVIEPAQAEDAKVAAAGAPVTKHTVCTHCSVGCSVEAVVQNGVWIRQEPAFDSPFNMGAHCAKGASVREHGHGEHRLRYPMKLVAGKYQRISWDQAINEIGDKLLALRAKSGPDS